MVAFGTPLKGEQMSLEIMELRDEASRYRTLADAHSDINEVSKLLRFAFELDSRAAELEAKGETRCLNRARPASTRLNLRLVN